MERHGQATRATPCHSSLIHSRKNCSMPLTLGGKLLLTTRGLRSCQSERCCFEKAFASSEVGLGDHREIFSVCPQFQWRFHVFSAA